MFSEINYRVSLNSFQKDASVPNSVNEVPPITTTTTTTATESTNTAIVDQTRQTEEDSTGSLTSSVKATTNNDEKNTQQGKYDAGAMLNQMADTVEDSKPVIDMDNDDDMHQTAGDDDASDNDQDDDDSTDDDYKDDKIALISRHQEDGVTEEGTVDANGDDEMSQKDDNNDDKDYDSQGEDNTNQEDDDTEENDKVDDDMNQTDDDKEEDKLHKAKYDIEWKPDQGDNEKDGGDNGKNSAEAMGENSGNDIESKEDSMKMQTLKEGDANDDGDTNEADKDDDDKNEQNGNDPSDETDDTKSINNYESEAQMDEINDKKSLDKCSFREYQPAHYYFLDATLSEQPEFLTKTQYIRGKLPFVINPDLDPKKLCIDTSEWEDMESDRRPFSDGQNPSVVSLQSGRIDKVHISPFVDAFGEDELNDMYLGLLLFGDSQCRWNLTDDELNKMSFSPLQEPPSKRSMVLILDKSMNAMNVSVLQLEHDAKWGEKKLKFPAKKDGNGFERSIVELDDARIFIHEGKPHVLYRNGPAYGYEKQVQNLIHFGYSVDNGNFEAYIKASETFTVCCGRNIAFISEQPNTESSDQLYALTWIDPVTVDLVDGIQSKGRRRLSSSHRLLRGAKKSSIHGTNGYMLPLGSSSELLGIAHFHRPEGRSQSDYARHGHHYTHAFFTIKVAQSDTEGEGLVFKLSRLSNEFVFASPSASTSRGSTADVIQFASGLDLVGSDVDGKLLISYGINDCEAASLSISMDQVQKLLLEVPDGDEVIDLMEDLEIKSLSSTEDAQLEVSTE